MAADRPVPTCLSIAGSDSGGGAGIQADLKAFARCGAHGMTAITAVTAQNTVGVRAVYPLPPEAVVEQVRAVAEDARGALRERLLPRVSVVTPNVSEAGVLAGAGAAADPEDLARAVHALG